MNNARRKDIDALMKTFQEIRETLPPADEIQELLDQENEAYDAMPEGLQNSDRGEALQDAILCLEQALDDLSEIESGVENILRNLEGARNV